MLVFRHYPSLPFVNFCYWYICLYVSFVLIIIVLIWQINTIVKHSWRSTAKTSYSLPLSNFTVFFFLSYLLFWFCRFSILFLVGFVIVVHIYSNWKKMVAKGFRTSSVVIDSGWASIVIINTIYNIHPNWTDIEKSILEINLAIKLIQKFTLSDAD